MCYHYIVATLTVSSVKIAPGCRWYYIQGVWTTLFKNILYYKLALLMAGPPEASTLPPLDNAPDILFVELLRKTWKLNSWNKWHNAYWHLRNNYEKKWGNRYPNIMWHACCMCVMSKSCRHNVCIICTRYVHVICEHVAGVSAQCTCIIRSTCETYNIFWTCSS